MFAGKLTYTDGSVYEGMWSKDVRDGVGTLSSANGTIFVGTFLADKRQGLGVIYWVGRCQKLVAEYVDDCPTCGVMMDLADNSAEAEAPITQQLRDAIAAARVKAIGASAADSAAPTTSCLELPGLQLVQPNQVGAFRAVMDDHKCFARLRKPFSCHPRVCVCVGCVFVSRAVHTASTHQQPTSTPMSCCD